MAVTVGLDIAASAVRAAVVKSGGKGLPVLERYGEVPLPEGVVANGEIVDESVVTDAVIRLFKEFKIPKKRVVVGLANQRVIVRQVSLPYMGVEELEESLEFQAQEYIPIPIDEAILDFVPIEEFATPEGEAMMSVLVIAAQREMANELLRVCSGAGIKPIAFDLQAFALVRAATGGSLDLDPGAKAVVNIGANITQVIVVRGGTVRFLRIIPMGGADFTRVLMDSGDTDRETAEQVKRQVGVAAEGPAKADQPQQAQLTAQADVLIEEIRSSLDFYLSQTTEGGIERLLISGNAARLPHLANRMKAMLGMALEPVRVLTGDPAKFELAKKSGVDDDQIRLLEPIIPVAVGLALWGEGSS